jgi:hypothetical protein
MDNKQGSSGSGSWLNNLSSMSTKAYERSKELANKASANLAEQVAAASVSPKRSDIVDLQNPVLNRSFSSTELNGTQDYNGIFYRGVYG